ncbi:nicotinamide riboside transporter PnuC [Hyphomonas sp. FCG-A18]|uniref:nicotinamide riboside transporter PnuC n=1 Tax=Hyphomonas sp. FCG-A18 TaxID=3080019 RepID=UPI002B2B7EA1|nr:nicotinamide riboside transporter PnuC [Hyphomonas sp. FCG-A18]
MTPLLWLEIAANAALVTAVFLAARNLAISWLVGILGCILFGIFFFQIKLYADVTLQVFFIVTNAIGWLNWQRGGQAQTVLPVTRVQPLWHLILYFPIAALAAWGYSELLLRFTDAHYPLFDSTILTFSIVAQLLLMKRKLETWIFWLIVNSVAVPLYFVKDAHVTAFVYSIFWFNAFYGFWNWRREMHRDKAEAAARVIKTVCFVGAESTGKSTLSIRLAEDLSTVSVEEYGRTLWVERNGKLDFEDYLHIAKTHIAMEEQAKEEATAFVFVDTTPLTTLFYSEEHVGRIDPQLKALSNRTYDFTFLCHPDFPMVQDGWRGEESFRQAQHEWYIRELKARGVPYISLTGTLEEKVAKVKAVLADAD